MKLIRPYVASRAACALAICLSGIGLCPGCLQEPPPELAVWSEFLSLNDLHNQLPTLADHGVELYVAVPPELVSDELWLFWQAAGDAHVPLRAWLQLPDQGVWLNEDNVAEFAAFATNLLAAAETQGVAIDWLIFDLEPDLAYAQALRAAAAQGAPALVNLLQAHRNAEDYAQAAAALDELINELHGRGVRVMAATLPWTLDDVGDGDPDIQDVFDTPLIGIPWDQVSVMVYRPVFSDLYGVPLSPGFVAGYACAARVTFGDNAQVAIGNISTPGRLVPAGYNEPCNLRLDLSAARSAGITSVSLFSLDGMAVAGGPDRWLSAALAPTPRRGYLDPVTGILRTAIAWLDRQADQRPPDDS